MRATMEIRNNRDFEGYFQKAAKFEQMGLGTYFFLLQIAGYGPSFYAPYVFTKLRAQLFLF